MLTRQANEIFGDGWPDPIRDRIVPVDVTPVDRWMRQTGYSDYYIDEMGAVRPPWPLTWVEWVPPDRNEGVERFGAIVFSQMEWGTEPMGGAAETIAKYHDAPDLETILECVPTISHYYLETTAEEILFLGMNMRPINEAGHVPTERSAFQASDEFLAKSGHDLTEAEMERVIQNTLSMFKCMWFAFALSHCKNVDVGEDSVHPDVQKKRRKTGKNPGMTFKTLEIEPFRKQVRTESSEGESDVERAFHICRGHFKEYTEDAPLFGKHTGKFWVPQHTRGSKDAGEVKKDYRVNEPNNQ